MPDPEPPIDLRAARATLGLTQAQLAPLLGVQPNTVARMERGELRVPEARRLLLARLLADAAPPPEHGPRQGPRRRRAA